MSKLYRLNILSPGDGYDMISGILGLRVAFGWREKTLPDGEVEFEIHCHQREFLEDLDRYIQYFANVSGEISEVEDQNWQEAWKRFFRPINCGSRFTILPPWLKDQAGAAVGCARHVLIEPKSAFGTGQHATTYLCLQILNDLFESGRLSAGQRFLDMGTGTGILGIACCLQGMSGVGVDIDPLAIENAGENVRLNNVGCMKLVHGGIEAVAGEKFDVVMANILARPLCDMAPEMAAACGDHACLVLSGILGSQARTVADAYAGVGLSQPQFIERGEWCALLWNDVDTAGAHGRT